jgi:hypothetical protein
LYSEEEDLPTFYRCFKVITHSIYCATFSGLGVVRVKLYFETLLVLHNTVDGERGCGCTYSFFDCEKIRKLITLFAYSVLSIKRREIILATISQRVECGQVNVV